MADSDRFHLKMAVHEALSNAVEHGNHSDPAKQVTLTCHLQPHQLAITVDDEGEGFDPADVPDPTREENLLREGGRGIFLIQRYADECRFENRGRRLVLVKHLH
jgi:serine/threonine-protein kinase RsbW